MSVEIEYPKDGKREFGDVKAGECFLIDDEVCIKTAGGGCTQLSNGALFIQVSKNRTVEPVDVKIIVKRR